MSNNKNNKNNKTEETNDSDKVNNAMSDAINALENKSPVIDISGLMARPTPKPKVAEFKVVSETSALSFEMSLNETLKDGWEIYSDTYITGNAYSEIYNREFVKYVEDEEL